MPNFTTDDLLLYLYNQLTPQQAELIKSAIEKDWALQQKFLVLKESVESLNSTKTEAPRRQTVHSILRYAEQSVTVDSGLNK